MTEAATRLMDIASVLRSKNAGAFVLTLDVIFHTQEAFDDICDRQVLNPRDIAQRYRVQPQDVSVIAYPQVLAIKVTLPRLIGSGDVGDTDVYGAQQHVPLMYLPVDSR